MECGLKIPSITLLVYNDHLKVTKSSTKQKQQLTASEIRKYLLKLRTDLGTSETHEQRGRREIKKKENLHIQ